MDTTPAPHWVIVLLAVLSAVLTGEWYIYNICIVYYTMVYCMYTNNCISVNISVFHKAVLTKFFSLLIHSFTLGRSMLCVTKLALGEGLLGFQSSVCIWFHISSFKHNSLYHNWFSRICICYKLILVFLWCESSQSVRS